MSDWSPPEPMFELTLEGWLHVDDVERGRLLELVGDDVVVDKLIKVVEAYGSRRGTVEIPEGGGPFGKLVTEPDGEDDESVKVARPPTRKEILKRLQKIETSADKLAAQLRNLPSPFFGWFYDAHNGDDPFGPLGRISDAASAVRTWTAENYYKSGNKDLAGRRLTDEVVEILTSAGVSENRHLRILRLCFKVVGESTARADQF